MGNYNGISERAGLASLVAFLADGDEMCCQSVEKDLCQKQVEAAFEHILDRLEQEFHISCRNNNEVCSAISDFLTVCRDAYFRAGLAAGFHICKNIEMEYLKVREDGRAEAMMRDALKNIL